MTLRPLECVAEYTHRPLLPITSGDVGTTANEVEENLTRYFQWAEDWRAILLLDEADVYLAKRSFSELVRNSVVSVFLRALEYYQGILFITTNRIGSIDEAFISRIHVQIWYSPFDNDMRKQVWNNNLNKLMKERGHQFEIAWNVHPYIQSPEVMSLEWNGREIRNGEFKILIIER